MSLLALALAVAIVVFFVFRAKKRGAGPGQDDASAALDALVAESLERELAESVLHMTASTSPSGSAGPEPADDERARLKKTLLGKDPDASIVTSLEQAVKNVRLEFVRYAHEADAEVTVELAYENGKTAKQTRRVALADLPRAVRDDFEKRGVTRAFRAWEFPWRRS